MPPLPDVYGTVGKIEPLLDTSIYTTQFADLPQDGESPRRVLAGGVAWHAKQILG